MSASNGFDAADYHRRLHEDLAGQEFASDEDREQFLVGHWDAEMDRLGIVGVIGPEMSPDEVEQYVQRTKPTGL